ERLIEFSLDEVDCKTLVIQDGEKAQAEAPIEQAMKHLVSIAVQAKVTSLVTSLRVASWVGRVSEKIGKRILSRIRDHGLKKPHNQRLLGTCVTARKPLTESSAIYQVVRDLQERNGRAAWAIPSRLNHVEFFRIEVEVKSGAVDNKVGRRNCCSPHGG